MRNARRIAPVAGLALAVAVAACDDGTSPELPEQMTDDVALVAADAVLEDVALMTAPWWSGVAAAGVPGTDGLGAARAGTRSITFYDAAGAVQDAYDAETTARIHYTMEMEASVTRGGWSGHVARSRDETVSGLEGTEATRTFDGTGAESVSRSRHVDGAAERSYEMSGTFTKTAVVVPVRGSESRWPLSGSIRRTVEVTRTGGPDGDRTRSVDITVTFDGDATATAVVGDRVFEIDLSARDGRNPLRRIR